MARKSTQKNPVDIIAPGINETLQGDLAIAEARNHDLAQIDATYGDMTPYDADRIINETRFYLQQSADAMLEAGKRLVLLKEHEPHGEFIDALGVIGIEPRSAQLIMQAAVKFSGPNTKALSHLGKTKLFELMTQDDDDLEALTDGGTLAGQTLDDIEKMSVRELKAALRKEREKRTQEKETSERLLESKNKKIDDLDQTIHDLNNRARPWPEQCKQVLVEVDGRVYAVMEALDQLDVLRDTIVMTPSRDELSEADVDSALEMMAVSYWDSMELIIGRVVELSQACNQVFKSYKNLSQAKLAAELPGLHVVDTEEQ